MKKLLKKFTLATFAATIGFSAFGLSGKVVEEREGNRLVEFDTKNNRYMIYLKGGPIHRGYNHGWLLADRILDTCSDEFVKEMVGGLLGQQVR